MKKIKHSLSERTELVIFKMPILFGYIPSRNQKPPKVLADKGIHLIRSDASSYKIQGFPGVFHQFFTVLTNFVFLIFYAIFTNRRISSGEESFYIGKNPSHVKLLPFSLPPLAVSFTGLTPSIDDFLRSRDFHQVSINDVNFWVKDYNVSVEDIRTLLEFSQTQRRTRVPWSYCNLDAILGYLQLIKYATYYSIVFERPAFANPSDLEVFKKKKRMATEEPDTTSAKSTRAATKAASDVGYVSTAVKWLMGNQEFTPNEIFGYIGGMVGIPHSTTTHIYQTSTVVDDGMDGFWFPFVEELSRLDDDGPIPFLSRHNMRNFGHSPAEQVNFLNDLKSAWGVLKRTSVSSQICHLFKCISIAMDCQAGVRVCFSGEFYEGCVIVSRVPLTLYYNNALTPEVKNRQLKDELKDYRPHSDALQEIVSILNSVSPDISDQIDPDNIVSMANIRTLLLARTSLPSEQVKKIKKLSERLRFPVKTWPSNPSFICQFLEILSGDKPIDSTVPFAPEHLDNPDTLETALSAFGRASPSFRIPAGRALKIEDGLKLPQERTIPARGRQPARNEVVNTMELTLQVRLVEYDEALYDWKRFLKEKTVFVAPLPTAYSSGYKVFKKTDRATIWHALSRIVNTESTSGGTFPEREIERAKERGKMPADMMKGGLADV